MPRTRRRYLGTSLLLLALAAPAGAGEAQSLFNGKDLDGWVAEGVKTYEKDGATVPVWTAQDGMILCNGKGFGFLRYDREQYADFVYRVEFRMEPKCNSGLGVRTTVFNPAQSKQTRPSYFSYEIQLIDDAGKLADLHSSGSLYRYVAPSKNAMKPAREWNTIEVRCVGPRIAVTLNGATVVDVDQETIPALKDKPRKGYVCLQNHGGTIAFRNVTVTEIASTSATSTAPESKP